VAGWAVMMLPFNADRPVAHVAAASGRGEVSRWASARAWSPAAVRLSGPPIDARPTLSDAPERERLENVIETLVVGEAEQLQHVLTDDAIGWTPALSYATRHEALSALPAHISPLRVTEFWVDRLMRAPPFLFAEWHLVAVPSEPFLVADDVLIDIGDEPVHLCGASVAKERGQRVESVHTYYDEAVLVEQLILRVGDDGAGRGLDPS
jgi:hypothetical protein